MNPSLVRTVAGLLITAAVASVSGRILNVMRLSDPGLTRAESDVESKRPLWPKVRPEPTPTHGDNDRSRWVTIRALVDGGTYEIGHRVIDPETGKYEDFGLMTEDGWRTIDKVMNPETHVFYSSKPTLMPTLLAGEYWLLKKVFGLSIVADKWFVIRIILLTVNALPFLFYLVLLSQLADWLGTTDWGKLFVVVAACFGTLMTPFLNTLNNHTLATCTAIFALYPALKVWLKPEAPGSRWRFIVSGFFAGFTATTELPSLAFTALLGFVLLLRAPFKTLVLFAPAVLVPIAGLLITNYAALGQLRPAYSEFGGPWYQFDGSHWKPDPLKPKTGIDWAKEYESRGTYAFHVLIGHHGLFALTPIWVLALARLAMPRTPPIHDQPGDEERTSVANLVALMTLILSVVVIGFYLVKSDNYGGWTTGLRWLIWLSPFWLLTMLPLLDRLAESRWGRGFAYLLLAVSVVSASYPTYTPWRHPWLYNWLEAFGWVGYG